jgi:DNA-binding MarR family transcriptional regulator
MVQATDSGEDDLARALYGLLQTVKRASHDDPVDRSAIIILARLKEHGPMRLSDLAGLLCLDVSTMSRHARTLEERGYIERAEDPADRRAVRLTLADAGRSVLATAFANRQAWLDRSLADWSQEERRTLTQLLGRLTVALGPDTPTRPDHINQQEETA